MSNNNKNLGCFRTIQIKSAKQQQCLSNATGYNHASQMNTLFGPLEENKQAHNMNMLYKGTESVGKSQSHNSAFGRLNCLIRLQSV